MDKGNQLDSKNKMLQDLILYQFRDEQLLHTALTHSSTLHEHEDISSNERMEFLGDAVLELCISDYLYKHYAHLDEGQMTRIRAAVVCEGSLALIANEIQLGKFIRMSQGEEHTGGREKPSILSDAVEALIGAIYLDGGFEEASAVILRFTPIHIEKALQGGKIDAKTKLQEWLQREGSVQIEYEIIEESGPHHARQFVAQVSVNQKMLGKGEGKSKKEAEQAAAQSALRKLDVK